MMSTITNAELNIYYMYPMLVQKGGCVVIVISTDDLHVTSTVLDRIGLHILAKKIFPASQFV
jgi:hypothetical protein